jgi:hypothetical protein
MFEITPDQQEKLLTDGFVSLSGAVPSDLIERWRALADRFEAEALEAHGRSERIHGACVIEDPVGPGSCGRTTCWELSPMQRSNYWRARG